MVVYCTIDEAYNLYAPDKFESKYNKLDNKQQEHMSNMSFERAIIPRENYTDTKPVSNETIQSLTSKISELEEKIKMYESLLKQNTTISNNTTDRVCASVAGTEHFTNPIKTYSFGDNIELLLLLFLGFIILSSLDTVFKFGLKC